VRLTRAKAEMLTSEGNTLLHFAASQGKIEVVENLLKRGYEPYAVNNAGYIPVMLAAENGHYEVVKKFHDHGYPLPNKYLEEQNGRPKACFQPGTAIITAEESTDYNGWLIADEGRLAEIMANKGGVLVVDETHPLPIVFLPEHKTFGVLDGDRVKWSGNDEPIREIYSSVKFFYGLPEISRNIVWKRMDVDPSLYLGYYHKVKGFLKPLHVLTRTFKDGKYTIKHLISPAEVLDIIGKSVIDSVFSNTEVLCLRNVYGEGTSLTHEEWEFMAEHLAYFPSDLTKSMVDHYDHNRKVAPEIRAVLVKFINWLLTHHPTDKGLRVVNKLVPFIKDSDETVHKLLSGNAYKLHVKIEDLTKAKYMRMLQDCDSDLLFKTINGLVKKVDRERGYRYLKQTELTGEPQWLKGVEYDSTVDPTILVRLFLLSDELLDWTNLPRTNIQTEKFTASSHPIVAYLKTTFPAEFEPTYEDLLAKGYIKVARALKELFHAQLIAAPFNIEDIKMAPIKELQRCRSKLQEYKQEEGKTGPFAAWVGDYLRATILCPSLEGMLAALQRLVEKFKVLRIKTRLEPNVPGNKVILVNLIVSDNERKLRPHVYPWSGWWDEQTVRMIAEVQIAHKDLFALDKQAHDSYEIARTNSCLEWHHHQGHNEIEKEIFPMSPLHTDPKCLL
jgi:hypothetical protein